MTKEEKAKLTIEKDDALTNMKLLRKEIARVSNDLSFLQVEYEKNKRLFESIDRKLALEDERFKKIENGKVVKKKISNVTLTRDQIKSICDILNVPMPVDVGGNEDD